MGPIIFILAAASLLPALDASNVESPSGTCAKKCKDKPLEISFVVDSSDSITELNFIRGLWFIDNFIDYFEIGQDKVRVSMVTFGSRVFSEDSFDLDRYLNNSQLQGAVVTIPYREGWTATGKAIDWFLTNQLPKARPNVRHILIVLTDGNSQQPDLTEAAAARAADRGLDVFAIGVGRGITDQELHNIASDSRNVFKVGSYKTLKDITDRLASKTCEVEPLPANPPKSNCWSNPVDIAFAIDASGSIGEDNFALSVEFINDFLEPFTIKPSSIRVAAVVFSNRTHSESAIPFDRYNCKKKMQDAISQFRWQYTQTTETGQGIDYMVQNFLPHARPHVPHIGIVLTDGESQNRMKTKRSAERAREAGMTLFAVGVGDMGDHRYMRELMFIAGDQSRVFRTKSQRTLNTLKAALTRKTCVETAA